MVIIKTFLTLSLFLVMHANVFAFQMRHGLGALVTDEGSYLSRLNKLPAAQNFIIDTLVPLDTLEFDQLRAACAPIQSVDKYDNAKARERERLQHAVNLFFNYRSNPLVRAQGIAQLIAAGLDINQSWDNRGGLLRKPLLHSFCELDDYDLAKQAIDNNADVLKKSYSCTPLHLACRYASPNLVRLLLDNGGQPEEEVHTITALGAAVLLDRPFDLVELLLARGASPRCSIGLHGRNLLMAANTQRVMQLLLDREVPIDQRGGSCVETALIEACREGKLEKVIFLGDHNANVNARCESYGFSPLIYACLRRNVAIAGYLLSRGAMVDSSDNQGRTPLHHALFSQYVYCLSDSPIRTPVVLRLLAAGARVDIPDIAGRTPFMDALANSSSYSPEDQGLVQIMAGHNASLTVSDLVVQMDSDLLRGAVSHYCNGFTARLSAIASRAMEWLPSREVASPAIDDLRALEEGIKVSRKETVDGTIVADTNKRMRLDDSTHSSDDDSMSDSD